MNIGTNLLSSEFGYSKTPNNLYHSQMRDGQRNGNKFPHHTYRNKSQYKMQNTQYDEIQVQPTFKQHPLVIYNSQLRQMDNQAKKSQAYHQ